VKMVVMSPGPKKPHAGWTAIDELAFLIAHYFGATLMSAARKRSSPLLARARSRFGWTYEPLECSGGDILIVVAHSPGDLAMVSAIKNVRKKFRHIHAFITDSYHYEGYVRETALFDSVSVTSTEDIDLPRTVYGINVLHMYQGIDTLRWAPTTSVERSIDVIGMGRIPASFHSAFVAEFHQSKSPHLYLHSPIGHVSGPDVYNERPMLFKLLQRSKISLAFHLFCEPKQNRPRSMMVTSRWLESLVSGCLVAGRRPESQMADDMLNWPNATIDLPDDPSDAHEALVQLLNRDSDFHDQRRLNIRQMVLQHDWRHRLLALCALLNWTIPPQLQQDAESLSGLADQFQ